MDGIAEETAISQPNDSSESGVQAQPQDSGEDNIQARAQDSSENGPRVQPQDKSGYYFHTDQMVVGYDGVPLIKDIEIRLEKGQILTLIGPNGAGKSTILKSITKQLEMIGGTVYLDGSDMHKIDSKKLSQIMSVVLTERVRPEMMTCEDVVGTGRYPYTGSLGILREEDNKIVQDAMEIVHITEFAQRDFMAISDGQRQRVMLARAICQEPDLMILDEPTSYLDVRYKLEFLSVLQRMTRERNLTVIMSLHELDLAERVSDKILCVHGNRIDRFGTPEEIFTPGYINELYGLTVGSYDETSGRVELPAVQGDPEVFVIAGNGSGTRVFRKLQRLAMPFACGILMQNDMDYPVAQSLAQSVVSVPPFEEIDDASVKRATDIIDGCKFVLCALEGIDEISNPRVACPLNQLVDYARNSGKQILGLREFSQMVEEYELSRK